MSKLADGLKEKRLRDMLKELEFAYDPERDGHWCPDCGGRTPRHESDCDLIKVLALPKTQAEKQAEALLELMKAIEHLYSLKPVPGNGWATLSDAGAAHNDVEKKLKACREAGLE